MENFNGFGLAAPLLTALAKMGYAKPTPIQAQAIPVLMKGRDLIGIAQTGTGKTAAFALPILNRLIADKRPAPRGGARVLVLSPTRELASQIAQSFRDLSAGLPLDIAVVFGGVPHGAQIRALAKGLDVLVATPGRLLDHLDARVCNLSAVEFLVLDEVDQMLDLGFIKPIRRIVRDLPRKRQNLFFSATMPPDIRKLAGELLHDPQEVSVTPAATTVDRVEQTVIHVDAPRKRDMLVELFADAGADARDRVHAHQARRRPRRPHPRRSGDQRARHSRQQEPGPARARACRVPFGPGARAGRDRHRRARHRHRRRQPRRQFRAARRRRGLCPSHRPHRARRARAGQAISLCDASERDSLRAIERLTRLRIFSLDRRGEKGPKPAPVVRKAEATPAPDRPHHSPHRDPRSANQQPHRARQGRRARPAYQARSAPAR